MEPTHPEENANLTWSLRNLPLQNVHVDAPLGTLHVPLRARVRSS